MASVLNPNLSAPGACFLLLWCMTGCFNASPPAGEPCSPQGRCPDGQECIEGVCTLTGSQIDAGTCDDDGARTCSSRDVLECQSGTLVAIESCAFGCEAGACVPFVPTNLGTGDDLTSGTHQLFVPEGAEAIVDTNAGTVSIDGATIAGVVTRAHPGQSPAIRVFSFTEIVVQGTLDITGDNLVALVSAGDITVSGLIRFTDYGNECTGTGTLGGATGGCGSYSFGSGGGGGFASPGGEGGTDCTSCMVGKALGGLGGMVNFDPSTDGFSPLRAGCSGGRAAGAGTSPLDAEAGLGGGGGGGLQLAALGTVEIADGGSVCAAGAGGHSGAANGTGGCGPNTDMGGGGGGSGGTIILEASSVTITEGGLINASGGWGANTGSGDTSFRALDGCSITMAASCSGSRGAFGTEATDEGCPGTSSVDKTFETSGGGGGLGGILVRSLDGSGPSPSQYSGLLVQQSL